MCQIAAADPPAWAGSEVSLKHSASLLSFAPGAELTYDPVLVQSLSVDPTWRISPRLRLTGHLGLETELTDSPVTSRERQPLLEDTTVTGSWRAPGWRGIDTTLSLRLALPTSAEAIARRRIVGIGPVLTARRDLDRGALTWSPFVTLRATYNWQLSTSLVYDGPSITTCDAERGDACEEFDHAGSRSAVAGFAQVLGLNVAWPAHDLVFTAQAWWVQSLLYDLAPLTGPDGEPVASGPGATDFRLAQVYLLAAEWAPARRWKLSGGLETQSPQRAPDGDLHAPFVNRYTQLFVTATAVF